MTHHLRPSRQIVAPLVLVATLVSLTACSGAGDEFARNLGLVRDAPDEFVVTTRDAAQLTLAPQSVGTNAPTTPTQGEAALLGAAKQDADPDVRNEVNRQATDDATKRSFRDRIMFWKDTPTPGVVVDASREAQRLEQNAALGRPITEGNTPVEQPKSKPNWLQRRIDGSSDTPNQTAAPASAPANAPAAPSKSWWNFF